MHRAALLAVLLIAPAAALADWPGWRGSNGDGVVTDPTVPLQWSATENVLWKVPVPGTGHSSPIVAGRKLFVTTCVDNDRLLLCYDRETGQELWRATVVTAPQEGMHKNNTPASATPVTDGARAWVTFLADGAITATCLDAAAGSKVWQRQFPGFVSQHGFCGTPILSGDLLIVNGDSDGDAFLAGLDKATGEVRWKVPRPNRTRSFSTPVLIDVREKKQIVLAGSKCITAFDPATGELVWTVASPTDKFAATVAYAGGLVIATGTSPVSTITAIRPDGTGDVTESHVAWSASKGAAYVPSPLAVGDAVFVQSDPGPASFLDTKTGKVYWTERLGRHHHASPLLVNGLVYSLADDGTMFVVKPSPAFKVLARNALGEDCHATPAVVAGRIYVRSIHHLWCIGTAPASR